MNSGETEIHGPRLQSGRHPLRFSTHRQANRWPNAKMNLYTHTSPFTAPFENPICRNQQHLSLRGHSKTHHPYFRSAVNERQVDCTRCWQ